MIPVTSSSPEAKARSRRIGRTDRGATMVEFAIIAIALFSMIFGIIEGAFAVRARNTINNAVDDAARRGAVAGTNNNADYLVLQQLFGRGARDAATVEYVVVYKADNGSAEVPADCKAGVPVDKVCNVFYPGTFDTDESGFGCPSGNGTSWCPNTRTSEDELSFLGVYVKAKYEPILDQLLVDFSFDVNANSLQVIETSGER